MGKYCCLLCPKEFSSESGVKYHILKAHAEVRQGQGPGGRALLGLRLDVLAPWRGRKGQGRQGGGSSLERVGDVEEPAGFFSEQPPASLEKLGCPQAPGPLPPRPPGSWAPGFPSLLLSPRTGSALRQTRLPDTRAQTPWCPERRRVRLAGRSGAASPRSDPLRIQPLGRLPTGTTGPQEAETRGPGALLAGSWEPARRPRSEFAAWQVGGARPPLSRVGLQSLLPSRPPPPTPACSSVQRGRPALSPPRGWPCPTRAAAGHLGQGLPGGPGQLQKCNSLEGPSRAGKRTGCSLGFGAGVARSRQVASGPRRVSSAPHRGSLVARGSGLMRVPEQPHLVTRHWNPSTPQLPPGTDPKSDSCRADLPAPPHPTPPPPRRLLVPALLLSTSPGPPSPAVQPLLRSGPAPRARVHRGGRGSPAPPSPVVLPTRGQAEALLLQLQGCGAGAT